MSTHTPRRLSRSFAILVAATVLGAAGMAACGSDSDGDQPSSPDTTIALSKNGALVTTTLPPLSKRPPSGGGTVTTTTTRAPGGGGTVTTMPPMPPRR